MAYALLVPTLRPRYVYFPRLEWLQEAPFSDSGVRLSLPEAVSGLSGLQRCRSAARVASPALVCFLCRDHRAGARRSRGLFQLECPVVVYAIPSSLKLKRGLSSRRPFVCWQTPAWLEQMIAHTTWRDLFYKLAEAHPDCLMLNFTVKVGRGLVSQKRRRRL